jgi:hypothetical protein
MKKIIKSFVGLGLLESFDKLSGIHQFAVSLIMLQYIVLSSLITIVSTYYGDYLINKFDLVTKYPKLAKFIELRRKFQNYYFLSNVFFIAIISIAEIMISLYILTF